MKIQVIEKDVRSAVNVNKKSHRNTGTQYNWPALDYLMQEESPLEERYDLSTIASWRLYES